MYVAPTLCTYSNTNCMGIDSSSTTGLIQD